MENLASYNVDKLLEGADHALYTAKRLHIQIKK